MCFVVMVFARFLPQINRVPSSYLIYKANLLPSFRKVVETRKQWSCSELLLAERENYKK